MPVALSALFLVGIITAFSMAGTGSQRPQIELDPRQVTQIKARPIKPNTPKFLSTKQILDAFAAKKVNTIGKKLSGPIVFTPRNPYNSDALYVEADRVATTSAIANEWHCIHGNGFYFVFTPPDADSRKPFILTLSGNAAGNFHMTAATWIYQGTNRVHDSILEFRQSLGTGMNFTLPVVVDTIDEVNAVRFWIPDQSAVITGIEYRSLG